MTTSRQIFKTRWQSPVDVRETLQAVLIAELLAPSRTLWLVSPWISDLGVIDNRSLTFGGLDPNWGPRYVTLLEVLSRLAHTGTHIVVATRPDDLNRNIIGKLTELRSLDLPVTVVEDPDLHQKGLLTDHFYLSGSMNLTFRGVEINGEAIRLDRADDIIAEAQITFTAFYPPQ